MLLQILVLWRLFASYCMKGSVTITVMLVNNMGYQVRYDLLSFADDTWEMRKAQYRVVMAFWMICNPLY